MLEFLPVRRSDITWMKPILLKENTKNADFSFTNIFAWGDVYHAWCGKINGCMVIQLLIEGKIGYSFPIGCKDENKIANIIRELRAYAETNAQCLRLLSVAPEKVSFLERHFPELFTFYPNTDLFDYIYSAEKLASLSGKKLHAKRNYVNRFIAENEWSYEPMGGNSALECLDLSKSWAAFQTENKDAAAREFIALQKAMESFSELDLEGGILRVSGEICAFTVGERLSEDTYVVHFEKALPTVSGAYQMINREFVRQILQDHPDILYINREDDMGFENLRKAKRSYYPEFLVEKYTAVLR
jgi:hypothetical protein